MIYLDHHATTPLSPLAQQAMTEAFALVGNASSIHTHGRQLRAALENARSTIAAVVGALGRELVFTSGGTEALHLAVRGVGASQNLRAIFIDPGAHPALQAACELLSTQCGVIPVFLQADSFGRISLEALKTQLALAPSPALVGVSWVQHETGAIASVREIGAMCIEHGALMVLDAVQALGKLPVDFASTGAVAAAVSAHKIGGPAGCGAAWIRHDVRARAILTGGAQERGMRAGTENYVGIAGFGAASTTVALRLANRTDQLQLIQRLEEVLASVPNFAVTPYEPSARVSTVLHGSVRNALGEEVVAALDLDGLSISSGPACSSGRPGPSAAMLRMFAQEKWRANGSLRISLGIETSPRDVDEASEILVRVLTRFAKL